MKIVIPTPGGTILKWLVGAMVTILKEKLVKHC